MSARFRPPFRIKWFYPLVLCGAIALAYGLMQVKADIPAGYRISSAPVRIVALLLVLIGFCVIASWKAWTARIDVEEAGVRWNGGEGSGFLAWNEIESLCLHGIRLCLVERDSKNRSDLPFTTPELYAALTARLNRLPPGDEEILFPKR